MASTSSSQFRVVYASLTEPTTVTVNGHVLGAWIPGVGAEDVTWSVSTSTTAASYTASSSGDPHMTFNAVETPTASLVTESVRFGVPTPAQKPPSRPHVSRGNMKRSRNKEGG
jgi:hypothetical protein